MTAPILKIQFLAIGALIMSFIDIYVFIEHSNAYFKTF